MKSLAIAGQTIEILPLKNSDKKGLWLELIANFEIDKFEFNKQVMLLFKSKTGINYTPIQLKKISERLDARTNIPVVFYFERLLTYERDRLIAQGVYFVVSNKYAFVPSLIINRKVGEDKIKEQLFPSTQYILLYHLQIKPIDGLTIKNLQDKLTYKYATIAKSVKQLQQLGLVELAGGKEKKILVNMDNKVLWEKAQPYFINPVKSVYYSPKLLDLGSIGNISALSHYSMLASEDVPTRAISANQLTELKRQGFPLVPFEDAQRIEVWKYKPLSDTDYVDRLSLYLTLRKDKDPRIEKELETMINKMQW